MKNHVNMLQNDTKRLRNNKKYFLRKAWTKYLEQKGNLAKSPLLAKSAIPP